MNAGKYLIMTLPARFEETSDLYRLLPPENLPVLAPGPAAVPELEVGELTAAGAGGKAGEPVAVDVGEPQLGAGVRAFLAGR